MELVKTVHPTQELQLMERIAVQTYANKMKSCFSTVAAINVIMVLFLQQTGKCVLQMKVNVIQIRLKYKDFVNIVHPIPDLLLTIYTVWKNLSDK